MAILIKLLIIVAMFTSTRESKHSTTVKSYQQERFYFTDNFIDTMKEHEGVKYYPYNCSANHKTVGAGHIILPTDNFTYPLNDIEVERLLKLDLLKAYNCAKAETPIKRWDTFSNGQKMAISKIIFHIGIGAYSKSQLKVKIDNNLDIEAEWLSWIYYTNKNGTKIKSDYMLKLRTFEIKLYYEK